MTDGDEPIVLDPDDPAFTGGGISSERDTLTLLAQRSAAAFAHATAPQTYLRSIGLTDPAVWSAFRIGAGRPELTAGFSAADWRTLVAAGLSARMPSGVLAREIGYYLPTFDPRSSQRVVGFVRVTPAQHHTSFVSTPVGVGCALDIGEHRRIVLAHGPLLGMQLHQMGARAVAVVQDPAVLSPLIDWLADREVVIASYKVPAAEAIRAGLGRIGAQATAAMFHTVVRKTGLATLRLVGIDPATIHVDRAPPPPITPQLIRDLVAFARERVAAGDAYHALGIVGADQPDVVNAYQLGYLPENYRDSLSTEAQRALLGRRLGNTIVAPAFDEHGIAVDLVAVYAGKGGHSVSLFGEPRGLIAPAITTAYSEVIVVDSLHAVAALYKGGTSNVLLVRGIEDVRTNADRLRRAGVRSATVRVRLHAEEVATSLRAAGIATRMAAAPDRRTLTVASPVVAPVPELPAPVVSGEAAPIAAAANEPPEVEPAPAIVSAASAPADAITAGLEFVERDAGAARATYRAGPVTYLIEIPWDQTSRLEVTVRARGHVHRDRFDLAIEAQRERFASGAQAKTGVAAATVEGHVVLLLDAVRALLARDEATPARLVEVVGPERDEAMALLRAPDLLDRIAADLDALGWVGEGAAKRLLYLVSVSRKAVEPLWAALMAASGAGKSFGMDLNAELCPPEELLQVSRLTDTALYHQDRHALRHKLIVVDEADALTPEVVVALRVLKTRGALSASQVSRQAGGSVKAEFVDARGPVALMTSTAGKLDDQLRSRCFTVPVDESPEQTARVLAAQRRLRADPTMEGAGGRRAAIVQRHRNLQRLLACLPVVIPFAERIEFPASSVRHRRDQERFLGLIEASALLHQHQRLADRGHVVATVADFEIAVGIAEAFEMGAAHVLGQRAQQLLGALRQEAQPSFTMDELERLRPSWTRWAFRDVLAELMEAGRVMRLAAGRGRQGRFALAAPTAQERIRLGVGGLAEVGGIGSANFTPASDTG